MGSFDADQLCYVLMLTTVDYHDYICTKMGRALL